MRRTYWIVAVALALALVTPGIAAAKYNASGTGPGSAEAEDGPDGNQPTLSLTGRSVKVSWVKSTFDDGTAVSGYTVARYNATTGVAATIGAGCTGTIAALTCTENNVSPGTWVYAITPRHFNWIGDEGNDSAPITIDPPSLTITTLGNITTLPKVLNGTIDDYLPGETVTWRLDNQTTGTILAGTITPSPVPASGTSAITVTIPAGTSNGTHTIFAIGSGGSVASATIAINTNDVTAPVVSAAVIAKTAGGTPGYIRQGGAYYIYANANDPGVPSSGVAQVRANVSNITTGQTNVSLTAGSYTVGGVTYGYRSNTLTATNPQTAGSKTFTVWAIDAVNNTGLASTYSVTVDNTAPAPTDIQTVNAGIAGRAEAGDKVIYTFSENMEPNAIIAGWTGASTTITVRLQNNGGGDRIQIRNAGNTATLPVGVVRLNRTDYVSSTVLFTNSTMTLVGGVITVTLGTLTSGTVTTAAGTGTMRWNPTATETDLAGNPAPTANFNEPGTVDVDF